MKLKIRNRYIGEGFPTYIIAEMSANHAGKIDIAKEIIYKAKESGADCIKLQTYTPDTLTINSDKKFFQIENGTWKGKNLYELYKNAYTPWEWQEELKNEAEKIGIDFFSTPFDISAVDFLESIQVEFYKIASFEITDLPLLKYIASKKKPIFISTGMATKNEIIDALDTIRGEGNSEICLLKCSSTYPANLEELNLKTITNMQKEFNVPIGFSDHSLGYIGAITAIALGANVIEKHFCLSREIQTADSSFSMEPLEFKEMVDNIRLVEKAIGKITYELSIREKESRKFRRSIFAVQDIKKGETITPNNIRIIRPGQGLAPKHYNQVLNQKAKKFIERGTPISWDLIEN